MSAVSSLEKRRREFDSNVWDHTSDEFQLGFDVRRPLDEDEITLLSSVRDSFEKGLSDDDVARRMADLIDGDEGRLFILLQLAGLTRNKILTDLKAQKADLGITVPSNPAGLLKTPEVWAVAGPYLAVRLRKVFAPLASQDGGGAEFEALNQATWPHWVRQERAKRQGHEAEYRVAVMLDALEIPFAPEEKSDNPLCRDAQIDGVSYDLVIPDLDDPKIVLKSTVQTSNIGQFGESKAHLEVTEAKESLAANFDDPPLLLALVDGVGFHSNTAGLEGVLQKADEFCQFKTIWKAAILASRLLAIEIEVVLPPASIVEHAEFLEENDPLNTIHEESESNMASATDAGAVQAGEALIWRP